MEAFRRILNEYAKPILRQELKLYANQTEFGVALGCSQQLVSLWLSDDGDFPPKEIPLLAKIQRRKVADVLFDLARLMDLAEKQPGNPPMASH